MRLLSLLGGVHGSVVHSPRVRVLAEHFAELIPQDCSVLDVGCGDGLLDALILERRPDLSITGCDVLVRPEARITVTPFDGHHLPFDDGSFDTVLVVDVLHHTDSPVEMLREAIRVARRYIALKDHMVEGWFARPTLRFMDWVSNRPHGVVLPYNYLAPQEWEAAFRDCGLTAQEVRRDVRLYPMWADRVFGRRLHFVGLYVKP